MYNIEESAKRLKELRRKTNKTQAQVAEEMGISIDTVSKNEQGKRGMSIDLADLYANYYGTSIGYIINGGLDMDRELADLIKNHSEDTKRIAFKVLRGVLCSMSEE